MLLSATWGERERVDYMHNCTTQKAKVVESSPRSSAPFLAAWQAWQGTFSLESSVFFPLNNITFMYTIAHSASI